MPYTRSGYSTNERRSRNDSVSSSDASEEEETNMDVTAMAITLTKSFQVAGVTDALDGIKNDLKKVYTVLTKNEQRLTRIEDMLEKLVDSKGLSIPNNNNNNNNELPRTMDFVSNGPLSNELSCWIRSSLANLHVENIKWNMKKCYNDPENIVVTNKVIDFVGSQITMKTNTIWTSSISHRELSHKIALVYRRRKSKVNMSDERFKVLKRKNTRKTRRVTKSKHRKQVLAHEVYGPAMRSIYGKDVDLLVIEQLQSDEESTDSEMGEVERNGRLKIIRPSWRSEMGMEVFKKFDEFDMKIRKNALKEKESRSIGRIKDVEVKQKYLDHAPSWSKV